MPVIKQISIHESPMRLIRYILNGDKNDQMKFATGLNCSVNVQKAFEDMKRTYEHFSSGGEKFSARFVETGSRKSKILLFHYIQSFKPGEVSPELAHKIGCEWARRVFGENRKVIISTHTDRRHVHNHFAVSVFDDKGKRWAANKKTLRLCRDISDKLAIEYGLSVIDEPKYDHKHNYGEWLHRKSGTSWKAKLADEIDRLVMDSEVKSVDDLLDRLRENGYEVKRNKYISICPPKGKHFIRTFRLGDGYSLESLIYRIASKEREISSAEVEKYKGIQYEYALCYREIQMMVFRRTDNYLRATYYDLVRNADLLCFLSDNHIESREQFENFVNVTDDKYRRAETRKADIDRRVDFEERLIADSARFLELWNKSDPEPEEIEEIGKYRILMDYGIYKDGEVDKHRQKLSVLKEEQSLAADEAEKLKAERKTAADNYRFYLSQIQGDFAQILERLMSEQEKKNQAVKAAEKQVREKHLKSRDNKER